MTPTRDQLIQAIAYVVHGIHPSWDRPGIEKVLHGIDPAVDVAAMAHAAIVAAKTRPDQRTPAVIAIRDKHWAGCLDAPPKPVRSLSERLAAEKPTTPASPETIAQCRARLRGTAS